MPNRLKSNLQPPPLNLYVIANTLMQFTAMSFEDRGYFYEKGAQRRAPNLGWAGVGPAPQKVRKISIV